jgi:hypothetical protein
MALSGCRDNFTLMLALLEVEPSRRAMYMYLESLNLERRVFTLELRGQSREL